MKKTLFALIAALFCFCSCKDDGDIYTYIIELGVDYSKQELDINDPEVCAVINEFEQAIGVFEKKYSDDWKWEETIFDHQSTMQDDEAHDSFVTYNTELKELFDNYQAKLDALPVKYSKIDETHHFSLTRYGDTDDNDKVIDNVLYTILHK